jgi:hypothetical protein
MRAERPLRDLGPPPFAAITLEHESTVGVRIVASSDVDEARLLLGLRGRDLEGELEAALAWLRDRIERAT